MEKESVKCYGICKTCAICKNLKEECHKRDEIAKAFMSEDFSNIYCTNHKCEIASAAELISRLDEFYMTHRMSDHLYRYIGSQVYGNDYIKDCLNNVAKKDEKSDKEKMSDEFLRKTQDVLFFTETGKEEDEFKSYYKYLDQALEYIKSIGGFPENMVTGGNYTPAYNRAAYIINCCILNKEHNVMLLDAIKANVEYIECSQEEDEEDEDKKVREINISYVFNIVSTSNSETYMFNNIGSYPMLYKKFKDLMYDFVCNRGTLSWDYQKFSDMMAEATKICDSQFPFGNLNMCHICKEMHSWLSVIEKDVMDFTNLKIYYSLYDKGLDRFQIDIFQFVNENADYSFILKFRHEVWDYKDKEDD